MTSANSEIRKTYDYEDAKEIVNHGCESGVCFKHIYYGDTVEFFNKFEDEITEYLTEHFEIDTLVSFFRQAEGWIDGYKNVCTWAFIESVCSDIVEEYESTTCEELDDEPIKLYADYSKSDAELLQKNGFNPVNSNLSKATLMAMNAIL